MAAGRAVIAAKDKPNRAISAIAAIFHGLVWL